MPSLTWTASTLNNSLVENKYVFSMNSRHWLLASFSLMFGLREDFLSDMSSSLNHIFFAKFFFYWSNGKLRRRSIQDRLCRCYNVTNSRCETYEKCLLIVHNGFLLSVCCSVCYIILRKNKLKRTISISIFFLWCNHVENGDNLLYYNS